MPSLPPISRSLGDDVPFQGFKRSDAGVHPQNSPLLCHKLGCLSTGHVHTGTATSGVVKGDDAQIN